MIFFWLTLSVLFFGAGEYYSKVWSLNPSMHQTFWVLIPYLLGSFCWLPALLLGQNLTRIGTAWSVLSTIMTLVLGLVVFEEKINAWNGVGIGFALVALILLQV